MNKKPKLTKSQEEQKKAKSAGSQYNKNTSIKKKHIKNNKNVLPFLANKNTAPLPVPDSTIIIPVITQRKNTPTKKCRYHFFNEPTENTTQVSNDSETSKNNLESTIPTVPTNIDKIIIMTLIMMGLLE